METLSLSLPSEEDIGATNKGYIMLSTIYKDVSQNLLVTGCAGSGKTILAIRRFQRLKKGGKKVYFLVFNKLLSTHLEYNLQEEIRTLDSFYGHLNYSLDKKLTGFIKDISEKKIRETFEEYVKQFGKLDAVVIDEGQDFPEKIYKNLHILFKHISVFGDNLQKINDNSSTSEQIEDILNPFKIELTRNFRNTPEIWETCKLLLPISERIQSKAITSDLISTLDEQMVVKFNEKGSEYKEPLELVISILDRHPQDEIGIFIDNIKNINDFSFQLKLQGINHAKYHSQVRNDEIELISPFLTTYKSAKGMEFDVVVLFIPMYGKNKFPAKQKFVGATRAKRKLYIIYIR